MTPEPPTKAAPSGGMLAELRRGWPTLAGATLGLAIGASALPFYTAGLFIVGLERDFGWTRTDLSLVGTVCTLLLAAIAPLVGSIVDRVGVRWPAAFSLAALAAGFFAMSRLSGSFTQYVVLQLALIVLAAGSTPIAFTRPLNAQFDRMRGLALGIAIGGIGLTAFIAPKVVGELITTQGWRTTFVYMAGFVLAGLPFVVALLSLGRAKTAKVVSATPAAPLAWPVRDPLFWGLIAAFLLVALAVAGFVLHMVPMLTDRGASLTQAASVQGLLGVAVLAGRLVTGVAMDRVFAPRLAAGMMLIVAAGIGLLAIGGPAFAVPAALAIGLAMGAEVDLIAYMTARYFGMAAYARLYGVLYGAFLVGTAFSPLLIAVVQKETGSYLASLWGAVAMLVAASTIFLFARPFPKS